MSMCRHFNLTVPSMTRNLPPKKHHIGITVFTILAPTDASHMPSLTIDSFNELGMNHDESSLNGPPTSFTDD
jgi:hypothetical protein